MHRSFVATRRLALRSETMRLCAELKFQNRSERSPMAWITGALAVNLQVKNRCQSRRFERSSPRTSPVGLVARYATFALKILRKFVPEPISTSDGATKGVNCLLDHLNGTDKASDPEYAPVCLQASPIRKSLLSYIHTFLAFVRSPQNLPHTHTQRHHSRALS
eukprot:m.411758 g.411758  ORF g.411758 m.411758 type:complete len:163 (-) comp16816_c0_seq47:558-1046(-)